MRNQHTDKHINYMSCLELAKFIEYHDELDEKELERLEERLETLELLQLANQRKRLYNK